jgi:hypothetical protein
MSVIPEKIPSATASLKVAQIVNLVKENQLLTAALLFISWQLGLMAQATTMVAGVC